jgi:hypothetical protein
MKKEVRRLKKGQITAFVIIGMIIFIAAFLFYIGNLQKAGRVEEFERVEPQFVPQFITQHIVSCLTENADTLIRLIASQGGELEFSYQPRRYNKKSYNYHCLQEFGYACVNRLITRKEIENTLNKELEARMKQCVNLSSLSAQGYQITEAPLTVKTTVAVDDIELAVDYPITVRLQSFEVENPGQSVKLPLPLGKLLDLAVMIVNQYINQSPFDKDQWMYQHGAEIEIEKHNPYPDTLYSLKTYIPETKDALEFNFAVQGKDTVSQICRQSEITSQYGYCMTTDNNCYYNTMPADCIKKGGTHTNSNPICEPPSKYRSPFCSETSCLDCGSRRNGESWCAYDGMVGDGLDLVGTRHYKKSCIDGKIYTEECRDYREELCTETIVDSMTKAVCRQNRWQDCAAQTTREECENSEERDCQWSEWLADRTTPTYGVLRQNHLCHPIVTPGFRHWQLQGSEVCGMASEQRDCDGLSCPQRWVDTTAAYCYHQGDCGNYYNSIGDFTATGYLNSDGAPRPDIYPSASTIGQTLAPLALRQDILNPIFLTGHEFDNKVTTNQLLDGIAEYVAWLARQDPEDYFWDYLKDGKVDFHVRHTALCLPWSAPFGGANCHLCNQTIDKPCTEYLCKSLGQTCEYEERDGVPDCFNTAEGEDTEGPSITFDRGLLSEGYDAQPVWLFGNYNCVEISPSVPPHTILSFGFNTSEQASCKLAPLPMINYSWIPSLSPAVFNTTHRISIRVTTLDQIREEFMRAVGLSTILELSMLETYGQKFQAIKQNAIAAAEKADIDPGPLLGLLNTLESQFYNVFMPALESIFDLVKQILILIDSRSAVVFVKCIDRSGNQNPEEFCVKYSVAEDTDPPEVLDIQPPSGTVQPDTVNLSIYLNEPAECKYGYQDRNFDDLEYWMKCPTSEFDTAFGNYLCTAEVGIHDNPTYIYFRCKDQPIVTGAYYLNVVEGSRFAVINQKFAGAIELVPPDLLNVTRDYILKNNETLIESNTSTLGLVLNFNRPMECRYTEDRNQRFEHMLHILRCDITTDYCSTGFTDFGPQKKTYYIGCRDRELRYRNENRVSQVVVYSLS